MKRLIATAFVFALFSATAQANFPRRHPWFGSRTTASYYYAPVAPYYYYYPPAPIYVQPAIVRPPMVAPVMPPCDPVAPPPVTFQTPPPVNVQPPRPMQRIPATTPTPQRRATEPAVPESAPPSERGPVVPPGRRTPPMAPTRTTSLRPREPYFSTYRGGEKTAADDGRNSVTFWNLSARSLTLRTGGQALKLSPRRSATLEVGRQFSWQINNRRAETARLSGEEKAMTVVIRR